MLELYHSKQSITTSGFVNEMAAMLGHDSAQSGYTGPGTTWANDFIINHAPRAGSIAILADQQSSALPLSHGCPP